MTWLERHAAELEAWAERMNREIKAAAESARRSLGQRIRWTAVRLKENRDG